MKKVLDTLTKLPSKNYANLLFIFNFNMCSMRILSIALKSCGAQTLSPLSTNRSTTCRTHYMMCSHFDTATCSAVPTSYAGTPPVFSFTAITPGSGGPVSETCLAHRGGKRQAWAPTRHTTVTFVCHTRTPVLSHQPMHGCTWKCGASQKPFPPIGSTVAGCHWPKSFSQALSSLSWWVLLLILRTRGR